MRWAGWRFSLSGMSTLGQGHRVQGAKVKEWPFKWIVLARSPSFPQTKISLISYRLPSLLSSLLSDYLSSLSSLLSLLSLLSSPTSTIKIPLSSSPGPAVMRGPIASRVITQLVSATEWGNLDYLIVDMPPGKYARHAMPYVHMSQMCVIECLLWSCSAEMLN